MFNNMIDNLIDKSQKSNLVNTKDYTDNEGLLVCGKCHTRKQTRITLWDGRVVTPMCVCKCKQEQLAKEEEERKKEERMNRIKRMRKIGFPDSEMERWTFDNDDKTNVEISKVANNYVNNFNEMYKAHKGLLLYGTVGTGKTFISACIANELINKSIPCLVTNFARLINTIQGMYEGKQEYIDSLDQFDLLVIDDLASERDTEYMNETVYNIIDARYRSGKPLIVTTNLSIDELLNPSDIRKQRIYSRILEMCYPFEVSGKDRRKQKIVDTTYSLLKK